MLSFVCHATCSAYKRDRIVLVQLSLQLFLGMEAREARIETLLDENFDRLRVELMSVIRAELKYVFVAQSAALEQRIRNFLRDERESRAQAKEDQDRILADILNSQQNLIHRMETSLSPPIALEDNQVTVPTAPISGDDQGLQDNQVANMTPSPDQQPPGPRPLHNVLNAFGWAARGLFGLVRAAVPFGK